MIDDILYYMLTKSEKRKFLVKIWWLKRHFFCRWSWWGSPSKGAYCVAMTEVGLWREPAPAETHLKKPLQCFFKQVTHSEANKRISVTFIKTAGRIKEQSMHSGLKKGGCASAVGFLCWSQNIPKKHGGAEHLKFPSQGGQNTHIPLFIIWLTSHLIETNVFQHRDFFVYTFW